MPPRPPQQQQQQQNQGVCFCPFYCLFPVCRKPLASVCDVQGSSVCNGLVFCVCVFFFTYCQKPCLLFRSIPQQDRCVFGNQLCFWVCSIYATRPSTTAVHPLSNVYSKAKVFEPHRRGFMLGYLIAALICCTWLDLHPSSLPP